MEDADKYYVKNISYFQYRNCIMICGEYGSVLYARPPKFTKLLMAK